MSDCRREETYDVRPNVFVSMFQANWVLTGQSSSFTFVSTRIFSDLLDRNQPIIKLTLSSCCQKECASNTLDTYHETRKRLLRYPITRNRRSKSLSFLSILPPYNKPSNSHLSSYRRQLERTSNKKQLWPCPNNNPHESQQPQPSCHPCSCWWSCVWAAPCCCYHRHPRLLSHTIAGLLSSRDCQPRRRLQIRMIMKSLLDASLSKEMCKADIIDHVCWMRCVTCIGVGGNCMTTTWWLLSGNLSRNLI